MLEVVDSREVGYSCSLALDTWSRAKEAIPPCVSKIACEESLPDLGRHRVTAVSMAQAHCTA